MAFKINVGVFIPRRKRRSRIPFNYGGFECSHNGSKWQAVKPGNIKTCQTKKGLMAAIDQEFKVCPV